MREKNLGKGVAITMVVMVFTVVMVQFVLPALLGGVTHRPEGAAYRFLTAVSTEDEHDVDTYGRASLVPPLREFARDDEHEDWFERVEVGRGVRAGATARVPALIVQRDAKKSADRTERPVTVVVHRTGDDWRVAAIEPRDAGTLVPSEGGDQPTRAPAAAWLIALAAGVALTLGASAVLRALGPPPAEPALSRS
jgi:hypothetical protein